MNRKLLILLTLSIILCASPVLPASVVIDDAAQFHFAMELMDKGDFARAVLEFERFTHFFPENARVPQARTLKGVCFMKAGRYEEAREVFLRLLKTHERGLFAQKALFLMGESYYQQGISGEAEYYFNKLLKEFPDSSLRNAALYRLGWTKIQKNEWKAASQIFMGAENTSPYYPGAMALARASLKGEALPLKSPNLAGGLAAVLPGLGHAYVGRYRDGGVAFIVNALFIWAAVEAFHQDQHVLGGMLTFLELGWYSGNIYSAVNATHKYNRKVCRDFRSRLKDDLDLKILLTPDRQVGLTVNFHF
jgi:TolA-binding protein